MEKIKTLVSMVTFVQLEIERLNVSLQSHSIIKAELSDNVTNYANFLSQPLALWMFVPVYHEGNVLVEPIFNDTEPSNQNECEDYIEAKSKCLFDGFKLIGSDDDGVEIEMIDNDIWITIISTSININHYNGIEWEIKTVEEMFEFLKEYGLQASLSETALNQVY